MSHPRSGSSSGGRFSTAAGVRAAGGSSLSPNCTSVETYSVPDLAGWRRTRSPQLPGKAFATIVPDWVCEVLSPPTASLDRVKKLAIYAREQVPHAWLIDPASRTLEVLRLEAGRWTILATHAGSDVVRAEPFTDIELELASLWADEQG